MLAMLLIENVSTLLMMLKDCCRSRSAFRCCVVCISRFPLPLPLSDRVPVVVAAVVFWLRFEGGRHGSALDSRHVDIVDADNNGLLSETNKQTRVSRL